MSTYPNYVRTLLLNQTGHGTADTLAEEYVSPDYLPRTLPAGFAKIRSVLFGGTPDRQMLNFRLYQLMQVLHATELAEYVTYVDDRITYLPFDRGELLASAFGSVVTDAPGTTGTLTIIGDPVPDEANGIIYRQWQVTVNAGNTVTIQEFTPTPGMAVQAYTVTDGLSSLIPLSGSPLYFNFSGTVVDSWTIASTAKPTTNMAEILATLQHVVSDTDEIALFGQTPVEPYLTWWNCWNSHEQYAYKLGGLLLALAYRTAALTV